MAKSLKPGGTIDMVIKIFKGFSTSMKQLVFILCAALLLTGCSSNKSTSAIGITKEEKRVRASGDYWQRSDDVSALYMTGPKAQHLLNKDIAACVAETRELVRLGSIGQAQAPSGVGMDPSMRQGWQSPTRDGPLYTEYTDFQDFDGCMKTKGWSRVDYVRPGIAQGAARNFTTTVLGHPYGWNASSSSSSNATSRNSNERLERDFNQ